MTDILDEKSLELFKGCVVRKDLAPLIKGGANVPAFVLEYLLANSCSTDDVLLSMKKSQKREIFLLAYKNELIQITVIVIGIYIPIYSIRIPPALLMVLNFIQILFYLLPIFRFSRALFIS